MTRLITIYNLIRRRAKNKATLLRLEIDRDYSESIINLNRFLGLG